MPLQFVENKNKASRLSFGANPISRMASVTVLDWDNITNKPEQIDGDFVDNAISEAAVRYNQAQGLTDSQQAQARENIGAQRAHWFNVKDYGATGDGATNDATAIQAAVTAAFAATKGGVVYFPAGTYIVGSQITWPKTSDKYVLCRGDGVASVIQNSSGFTSAMFYVGSGVAAGGSGVQFEHIKFKGASSATARALSCENANLTYFNKVTFQDLYIAVSAASCFAVRFTECSWDRISLYGLYSSTAAHNLIVNKCAWNDIGYTAATSAYGIRIDTASDNVSITDCDFEYGYVAIQLAGGSALRVSGNYIEYFSNTSIYSTASMTGAEISRNWVALGGNQLLDNFVNSDYVGNTHYNITLSVGTGTNILYAGNTHSGTGSIPASAARRLMGSGTETTQFLTARTLGVQNQTAAASVVANQQIGAIGFFNAGSVAIAGVTAHYTSNADGSASYLSFKSGNVADQAILDATGNYSGKGSATFLNATAVPAGGTAGAGVKFSSTTNLGMFFGSGSPTLSAAKGAIYLRTDGSTTNDRMYINTNGGTSWAAVITAS